MKLRWSVSGVVCALLLLTLVFSDCFYSSDSNSLAAGLRVSKNKRVGSNLSAAAYYADIEGGYPYRQNAVTAAYDDSYSVILPGKGNSPFHYRKWNSRIDYGTGVVPFVTGMGGYSATGGAYWNGTGARATGAQPNRLMTITPEQALQTQGPIPINNAAPNNAPEPAEQPAPAEQSAPDNNKTTLPELPTLPQAPLPKTAQVNTQYNQEFIVEDGGMIYDDCPFPELCEPAPKKKCFLSSLWDKMKGSSCLSGSRKAYGSSCLFSGFGKGTRFPVCDPCFACCDPCFSCCDPCFSCCDPCFSCCDPCFSGCDPCFSGCGSSFGSISGGCSSCGDNSAPMSTIPQQQLAPTKIDTAPEAAPANPAIPAQPMPAPAPAPAPASKTSAGTIHMIVPDNAVVYINGYKTKLSGSERSFTAKNLVPGETYDFEVKVVCAENGKQFEQVKTTTLTPGSSSSLAFDFQDLKKMEAVALVK